MIPRRPIWFKKLCVRCLLVMCGACALYPAVISVASVRVGLANVHRPGFWLPIVVGVFLFWVVFWALLKAMRRILSLMKEDPPAQHFRNGTWLS